jgi:NTP pyrophosphatase (non-canonical NTP hydrolase)
MLPDHTVDALLAFRHERDWEQFHTPKNLAIAIAIEAAELLEHFQWTTERGALDPTSLEPVSEEIADVAILLTYLAHDLGVDLNAAVTRKLVINGQRYPAATSRGHSRRPGSSNG